MNDIFSEIYGCYYRVAADILRAAPISRRQAENIAFERGYGESVIRLIPKLLGNGWRLLEEREGLFYSKLQSLPDMPVTKPELAWLKSIMTDPRIRLFLTDEQLKTLDGVLKDVEPLFRQEDILYFDRYLDGDDYASPVYRERFKSIMNAMREKRFIKIIYAPIGKKPVIGFYLPVRLEYSAKDDKFRIYTAKVRDGAFKGYHIMNLSRIASIKQSGERYDGPLDFEKWKQKLRCDKPALIRVTNERNGIERFMVEFSFYEKRSEYDESENACTVKLWYNKDDETEVLIRLLGFGPVLRILGPERLVDLARERVLRQSVLNRENGFPQ